MIASRLSWEFLKRITSKWTILGVILEYQTKSLILSRRKDWSDLIIWYIKTTSIMSTVHARMILSVRIFDVYYFVCDFSDCGLHLYCSKLKHNVSATVSSSLPPVSLVYLGIEMIQPGKSFLKLKIFIVLEHLVWSTVKL